MVDNRQKWATESDEVIPPIYLFTRLPRLLPWEVPVGLCSVRPGERALQGAGRAVHLRPVLGVWAACVQQQQASECGGEPHGSPTGCVSVLTKAPVVLKHFLSLAVVSSCLSCRTLRKTSKNHCLCNIMYKVKVISKLLCQ